MDEAIAEIQAQRDRQFDPHVVDAFLTIQEEIAVAALGVTV